MDAIATLVAVRERTAKEVAERLCKRGFTEQETNEALEEAMRCGLIDEERYTRAYIRGKTALGWGRLKIKQKLEEAGISDELVSICEEEFADEAEELAGAKRILMHAHTQSANPSAAYIRKLMNKGYSYDTAFKAVREHLESNSAEYVS